MLLDTFVTFVGVFALLLGGGLAVTGLVVWRRVTREHRVRVHGVVVHWSPTVHMKWVTFDYPLPDGRWSRARRVAGLAEIRPRGRYVQPGDPITVYVNPRNPHDVTLGSAGSATGLIGLALLVVGGAVALGGLGMALRMAL